MFIKSWINVRFILIFSGSLQSSQLNENKPGNNTHENYDEVFIRQPVDCFLCIWTLLSFLSFFCFIISSTWDCYLTYSHCLEGLSRLYVSLTLLKVTEFGSLLLWWEPGWHKELLLAFRFQLDQRKSLKAYMEDMGLYQLAGWFQIVW